MAQSKFNHRYTVVLGVLLCVLAYSWVACIGDPDTSGKVYSVGDGRVDVIGWDIRADRYGDIQIVGKLRNETSGHLKFVSLEFRCNDKDGVWVESPLAVVYDLYPGETVQFDAYIFSSYVDSCTIYDISGL